MAAFDLPKLPASHTELVKHIAQHPEQPMVEIISPYRKFEARLREVYAQDPRNPALEDCHINVVPVFTDDTKLITTRARNLSAETDEEKSRYIMPLADEKRRPHGSPATVPDLAAFQHNFNVFSESSLVEMDWSNVVAAGSSVLNCLLPVPPEFKASKRKLREYYHEKFCPASDVDLFLYGLTHDEAIEKMKQIEQAVRDAILNEVTVVRTKYAITIASQYPVRHIQIVLRIYKSVSEILTGFDIDAAGAAYDGKQVYLTPRALGSIVTQINHVDLSRRSPSYENRLSKYSHRNFEVYWPELDRSRIDPTIFERSFQRTLGLARLLVLERLPSSSAREAYLNRRREERGRPTKTFNRMRLGGNIKDSFEDEIADWAIEEDVSSYTTFTVPYGQRFHAKRIERLCYTRDLLLNAEWNEAARRDVYLHRHPAFFGRIEDVIEDCCGFCPSPVTVEEIEVAQQDAAKYVSGKIGFITDDPGRQQIGSFRPLTDHDWTDMAYVGNTARLCQSMVDQDADDVLNWLQQPDSDPNKRDYTGRTPLHLAVMVSTPEIVKSLIDHGARLTARLADGRTALHLAAARGDTEILKMLMQKSAENEEAANEAKRRRLSPVDKSLGDTPPKEAQIDEEDRDDAKPHAGSDSELMEVDNGEEGVHSVATSSYVQVSKDDTGSEPADVVILEEESLDEPDYFNVDTCAWDVPCSPLHLAITEGHEEAVKLLCEYGADAILPVKFLDNGTADTAAILTLALALSLSLEKAKSMARLLLSLRATSSQADANGYTAFQRYVDGGKDEMVDILMKDDKLGVKTALNHLVFGDRYSWDGRSGRSPLRSAIECGNSVLVLKLLNAGASPHISFDTWLKSAKSSSSASYLTLGDLESSRVSYSSSVVQPLIAAIECGNTEAALQLLNSGADPNTLTPDSQELLNQDHMRGCREGRTALDVVRDLIGKLSDYTGSEPTQPAPCRPSGLDDFIENFEPGTYKHFLVSADIKSVKDKYANDEKEHLEEKKRDESLAGLAEKKHAIEEALKALRELEIVLITKGAKVFLELHPGYEVAEESRQSNYFFSLNPYPWIRRPEQPRQYKFNFQFSHDDDMTDARRDGYIELMEAAWKGDLDRITSLTLKPFGPGQDSPPLKIAITDNAGNSPFSLAFHHGHQEVAQAILEIVKAHWSPPDEERSSYRMREEDEESAEVDEYDGDEEGSRNEPELVSEKVSGAFTTEDIGKVCMQVKSHVKPLEILCSSAPSFVVERGIFIKDFGNRSLFVHALDLDDAARLRFLLDSFELYAWTKTSDEDKEPDQTSTFPEADFMWALEHGKTRLLGEIIQRLGAGIPLNHLVKKSGIEIKEKPRYYQGLTVYGSKKKNWATAGRNLVTRSTELKTPPLLHAALGGSLEAVEYFLSDTPHRLYAEFSKSKTAREDKRLQHLNEGSGGFDRAIEKWLGADNDLVIHCAVLSEPTNESHSLLEYIVKACPESLDRKTTNGDTPLMLACRLGRVSYCKILVDAGADQSTRNNNGENIVHAALSGLPSAAQMRCLLDLIDPGLRPHLFTQRTSLAQNGNTPWHHWISTLCWIQGRWSPSFVNPWTDDDGNDKHPADMVKLLLEHSGGHELDFLNGAGETCLHTAIRHDLFCVIKTLVEHQPRLLLREDAVGRTAAELAHDRQHGQVFARPLNFQIPEETKLVLLPTRSPRQFMYKSMFEGKSAEDIKAMTAAAGLSGDYDTDTLAHILGEASSEGGVRYPLPFRPGMKMKYIIWDYCSTVLARCPGKRRLVSLNEANDVARRLGESQASYNGDQRQRRDDGSDSESQDGYEGRFKGDFVSRRLQGLTERAWQWSSLEKKLLGVAQA